MHELGIAKNIFETVEKEALNNKLEQVCKIGLDIGAMTAIVPDALEFGFEVITKDTILEGVKLEINNIPMKLHCNSCGLDFEPDEIYDLVCPGCGKLDVKVLCGEEFRITFIEGN